MDLIPLKVAARYLGQKLADSMGDPKALLEEYGRVIYHLTDMDSAFRDAKVVLEKLLAEGQDIRSVRAEYSKASDLAMRAYARTLNGMKLISIPGHNLFLALIQTYTLPPALRKKVEIASRTYLKNSKPRITTRGIAREIDYIGAYEKFVATLRSHYEIAKEAVAKGKEHSTDGPAATKVKVGPFTLVNTGGFSEKQMAEVADVVEKATSFAKSSGLGEVCYGEVQVTNTISKANVLAFYLIAKDELFIRANVKATTDTLQTVLHELGHRFEHKFLKDSKRGTERLYHMLAGQEIKRKYKEKPKEKIPQPGETMVSKGKTYTVVRAIPDFKSGYKIVLQREGTTDGAGRAAISLEGWLASKGESSRDFDNDPNYIGYVSDYAKSGGPAENFAEMFAFYCMGRLPVLQSVPFEALVFGDGKLASSVADRFATVREPKSP